MRTYSSSARWLLLLTTLASTLFLIAPSHSANAQAPTSVDAAVGSTFNYQGRLNDNGNPANGNFDFQFILYDGPSGGNQKGSTLKKDKVTVSNGLFNVPLDFGQGVFDGTALFIEVGVKPAGSASAYTVLSPRTGLNAVPYALGMPGVTVQNGTISVSGDLHMSGNDFVFLPSSQGDGGRAIVHHTNDRLALNFGNDFAGGVIINGKTVVDGDLQMTRNDFVFLPSETGDGGRAIVHGGNDSLVLNFANDFSSGVTIVGTTTVDGDVHITRNDLVFLPSETGDGGRAIVHGGNDSLVLNFANDFSGGTVVEGNLSVSNGSFIDDGTTLNVPDYVFEKDYKLMSLDELATFLAKEKHLPGVPSQDEIHKNGLNMSQFNMHLLEKVEELTLYTLAQQKQIDAQQQQINDLAARLAKLEK